jgi:uncharacterized protein (DUF302 family)
MDYYFERRVTGDIDEIDATIRDALSNEGFGVLTEIDVTATLQKKLGIEDDDPYRILGACHPELAHQALDEETALGALLPCNVVLYEADDEVVVCAVDPEAMLSIVNNPELDDFATEVKERLERAVDTVAA